MLENYFSPKVIALAGAAEARLHESFARFERVSEANTAKVLAAFRAERVSEACFAGSTGYGYDDLGRATLERVYARAFGAESALVRLGFVNGTHAIASALFAACQPGKTLLAATGSPYDTLLETISGGHGSLRFYGVGYREVALKFGGSSEVEHDLVGEPNLPEIKRAAASNDVCAVLIQRSRGYSPRRALSVPDIGEIITAVRSVNPAAVIVVDNCYGEFTGLEEPTQVGADLIAGSLIKNPGGGLAPTGGYVAGKAQLVERAAERLTVPGIGGECGASLGLNRSFFQGFFMAPHAVCQALKTAAFAAAMLESLGLETSPAPDAERNDIIQTVRFGTKEKLLRFCAGLQRGAPVDSFVTPEPWAMPGYSDEVVMAAGAFIQGSSIELSCDGPMREPFWGYMQGGLTYEAGKIGVMTAVEELLSK
ncbi:MAG: methionine gamma-lyase family protein [Oscillospiraceae bacterium]|jgi:cystathionine beta-lyase family protein involved in aluminum resistance|nr:methionine gamma-lyase family protein [Oscillospiraceae bacterium]